MTTVWMCDALQMFKHIEDKCQPPPQKKQKPSWNEAMVWSLCLIAKWASVPKPPAIPPWSPVSISWPSLWIHWEPVQCICPNLVRMCVARGEGRLWYNNSPQAWIEMWTHVCVCALVHACCNPLMLEASAITKKEKKTLYVQTACGPCPLPPLSHTHHNPHVPSLKRVFKMWSHKPLTQSNVWFKINSEQNVWHILKNTQLLDFHSRAISGPTVGLDLGP